MIDFQKAMADPEAECQEPNNVVKDTELSKEQKLKILQQWKHDANLIQIAEEENMRPGEEHSSTMLSRISQAIEAVNNQ